MSEDKKHPALVKDKYTILGKDSSLSYKFVGPRRMEDYFYQGWSVLKKEDHPKLVVPADLKRDKRTGPIQVGPFTLMYAPKEIADARKEANEQENILKDGITKGSNDGRLQTGTVRVDKKKK